MTAVTGRRGHGEVPERLNGPVSKTGVPLLGYRGFESHPLRHDFVSPANARGCAVRDLRLRTICARFAHAGVEMARFAHTAWDRRRSRRYAHIGKVSVFFRGASWCIYYREAGRARRESGRASAPRRGAPRQAALEGVGSSGSRSSGSLGAPGGPISPARSSSVTVWPRPCRRPGLTRSSGAR